MVFIRKKTLVNTEIKALPSPGVNAHEMMCRRAERFLRSNGFPVTLGDGFRAWSNSGELPDAIGFRNGASCLIECKCSRADFLADRKKPFRIAPETGLGDWRFYLSEPGIITVADLPPGWGLLYLRGRQVLKVFGWTGNAQWLSEKPFKANKQAECDFLYSALKRSISEVK